MPVSSIIPSPVPASYAATPECSDLAVATGHSSISTEAARVLGRAVHFLCARRAVSVRRHAWDPSELVGLGSNLLLCAERHAASVPTLQLFGSARMEMVKIFGITFADVAGMDQMCTSMLIWWHTCAFKAYSLWDTLPYIRLHAPCC